MVTPDSKKKFNFDNITILHVATVVVTLFIGVVLIYSPFLKKNRSLKAEILEERDRNLLIGKIKALNKHKKVYKKRIPEGRSMSWLLSEVSTMASKEEIEVSSIKPGNQEDMGSYTKLYINMDIIAAYHQLGKFLSSIESSEKFMMVEKVSLERLDLAEGVEWDKTKFKDFDLRGHIVVSAIVMSD